MSAFWAAAASADTDPPTVHPAPAEAVLPGPAEAVLPGPGPGARLAAAFDPVGKILGAVLSVLLALLTGVLEVMLASVRVAGVLVGVSVLLAVVANVALAWFATTTVGRRRAVALPWLVWTSLMFFAAGTRTDEGDFLLAGNSWVPMATILLGSLAFAGYAYRAFLPPAGHVNVVGAGRDAAAG